MAALPGQRVSHRIVLGFPPAAAWGQAQAVRARFWQTPVLPAVRALSAARWDGSGGGGRREEGQPLGEPGHPPRWSGDAEQRWFFHQSTRERAAAHVHQTLRSPGTTTCTRESSRTFLSTQRRVRALRQCVLCSCPLSPLPVGWCAKRGLLLAAGRSGCCDCFSRWLVAQRSGWVKAARFGSLPPFGFLPPSPNALLVPGPPRRCPSAPPAVLCSHLGIKPLSHLIAPVPVDPIAVMLRLCLPYLQPPWLSTPQRNPPQKATWGSPCFFALDPFWAGPALC